MTATQFGGSYTPTLGTGLTTYWLDSGTSWSVTNPLGGSGSTERWDSSQTVLGTVSSSSPTTADGTLTFTYYNQYSISITSSGISTDSSGMVATLQGTSEPQSSLPYSVWVNSGASCTYSFTSPVTSTTTGKEYVWSRTSGLSQTGQSSSGFTVSTYGTITGTYGIQYQLTVTSAYSSTTGSGWYNSGSTAYAGLSSGTVSGGVGTQYVFTSWSGGASGTNYAASNAITMIGPETATAAWQTQYYLTVTSSYGSPTGAGWYNAGGSATFGVTTPTSGGTGVQYALTSWVNQALARIMVQALLRLLQ